jgi:hypothetical protein
MNHCAKHGPYPGDKCLVCTEPAHCVAICKTCTQQYVVSAGHSCPGLQSTDPPRRDLKPLSFEEMKTEAAKDLRAVADLFEMRARAVEAGDMDAFYKLITEEIHDWHQMLVFRQGHRGERREIQS